MGDGGLPRYNAALLASTISLLAWACAALGVLAAGYFFLTDGPADMVALGVVGSVVIGIVFARLERRYVES